MAATWTGKSAAELMARKTELEQELGEVTAALERCPPAEVRELKGEPRRAEARRLEQLKAEFAAKSPEEKWKTFERLGRMLEAHHYIFAKTMPKNPHFYTLRRQWQRDEDFVWVVEQIRVQGYRKKYEGYWYIQLDVNGWFYWTMGAPILHAGHPDATILINRKRGSGREIDEQQVVAAYDQIAPVYDTLFDDPASLEENARVFGYVGDLAEHDVLDVGCGTGLALDYAEMAASYTGIDPSQAMLDRLVATHEGWENGANVANPTDRVLCTALESFVPTGVVGGRYDVILALFGVGSYLRDHELERIPLLLRPGGRAIVMFYDSDYVPTTYVETGISAPHRAWDGIGIPGASRYKVGHHILCVYEKPR